MSPAIALKYNPGLRGDQELLDRFKVRQRDLSWILGRLDEATAVPSTPCQHLLVIGARGMGKTSLVRRVAAEVRREAAYSTHWYPIVFPEEAYLPSTAGEFWLEAIFHLAEQLDQDDLRKTYVELRREADESRLSERCLAVLLEWANREGKRLLLVVENLGMLLGEQISERDAWRLRQTLQHEPRVMMLATAAARFEHIDGIDHAWFELFATQDLEPLSRTDCESLWTAVNGKPPEGDSIRAVEILTGGNVRLVTMLAEFSIGRSFRELMDRLIEMVDSHTAYFKSHLDALPPVERKVFAVLLDLWAPSSASEVAQAARLNVNLCSSMLKRLAGRGAVTATGERKRDRRYQVTERLFNIYYLMRRRGENQQRAEMLVSFMRAIYSEKDLKDVVARMMDEIREVPAGDRGDWFGVWMKLAESDPRLIRPLSPHILRRLGAPQDLLDTRRNADSPMGNLLLTPLDGWFEHREPVPSEIVLAAHRRFETAIRESNTPNRELSNAASATGWTLLARNGKEEATEWATRACELDKENHHAWSLDALIHLKRGELEQAKSSSETSLQLDSANELAWAIRLSACADIAEGATVQSRMLSAIPDSDLATIGMVDAAIALRSILHVELTEFVSLRWAEAGADLYALDPHVSIPIVIMILFFLGHEGHQEQFIEGIKSADHQGRFDLPLAAYAIRNGQPVEGPPEFLQVARDLAAKIEAAAAK